MTTYLNEDYVNNERNVPRGSTVVFDWDNTLKVFNREKKQLTSRISPECLLSLIQDKGCELYIISAIQPSRINMEALLMEVDKLGLRELFCTKFQHQLTGITFGKTVTGKTMNMQGASYQTICPHATQVEMVNGEYRYVRWGNIIICGYDKAEVFLELTKQQNRCVAGETVENYDKAEVFFRLAKQQDKRSAGETVENYDEIDICKDSGHNKFQYEGEVEIDDDDDDDDDDDKEGEDVIRGNEDEANTLEKPIVFFDDEEINIINFQALVKNSRCVWIQ